MPTRREARTSVLPEGQNLGAGGIQFRRAFSSKRGPRAGPCVGSYGGPSKEAVTQQIKQIEAFVAERKG